MKEKRKITRKMMKKQRKKITVDFCCNTTKLEE